jgi:hypothetical protein
LTVPSKSAKAGAPGDALASCTEGSDEEAELEAIIDLIEARRAASVRRACRQL